MAPGINLKLQNLETEKVVLRNEGRLLSTDEWRMPHSRVPLATEPLSFRVTRDRNPPRKTLIPDCRESVESYK